MENKTSLLYVIFISWMITCCVSTFRINKETEKVETAKGFVTYGKIRKRSVRDTLVTEPETFDIDFTISSSNIHLHLQRNDFISANVPTFTSKDGVISKFDSSLDGSIFYQDLKHGGVFVIKSRKKSSSNLFGVFNSNNMTYKVENKMENSTSQFQSGWNSFDVVKENIPYINFSDSFMGETIEQMPTKRIHHKRYKRASGNYVIELLIVVDYSAYANWYSRSSSTLASEKETDAINSIKQYYAFIVAGMDGMYKNIQTTAYTISIVYAGVIICQTSSDASFIEQLNKDTSSTPSKVDSSNVLDSFAEYAINNVTVPYDHAMLFSRYDFVYGGTNNAGLAFTGTMCGSYSMSVVEESDNYITITLASHELGHCLSAQHDGVNNNCLFSDQYIMASSNSPQTSPSTATNPWIFSQCSTNYFTSYIDSLPVDNCMTSFTNSYDPTALSPFDQVLPGQIYTADQQCRNIYGDSSKLCRRQYDEGYATICTVLWCEDGTGSGSCYTNIAGDGTHCGNKKWCIGGVCTYDANAPSGNENCLYGDNIGPVYSNDPRNCSELVSDNDAYCQQSYVSSQCCQSCPQPTQNVETTTYGETQTSTTPITPEIYTGTNEIMTSTSFTTVSSEPNTATESPVADVDLQCRRNQQSQDSRLCRSLYDGDYSNICSGMYCLLPNTTTCNSFKADDRTLCGNQKWCINGVCTSDPAAPLADETCLHGDQPGAVFSSGATCADMKEGFPSACDTIESVRVEFCCATCASLTTTTSSTTTTTITTSYNVTTTESKTDATTTASTTDATTTVFTTDVTTTASTSDATTTASTTDATTTASTSDATTTASTTDATTTASTSDATTTASTTDATTTASTTDATTTASTTDTTTTVSTTDATTTASTTDATTTASTTDVTTTASTTDVTTTASTTDVTTTASTTDATTTASTTDATTTASTTDATTVASTTDATTTASTTDATTTASTTDATTTTSTTDVTTTVSTTEATTTASTTDATTTASTTDATTTASTSDVTTTASTTDVTTTASTTDATTTASTTDATTTASTTDATTTASTTDATTTASTTDVTTTASTTDVTTTASTTDATTTASTTDVTTTASTTDATTTASTTEVTTTASTTDATTTASTTDATTTASTTDVTTTASTTDATTTASTTDATTTASTTDATTTASTTDATTTASTTEVTTTASTTDATTTASTTDATTTASTTDATTTASTTDATTTVSTIDVTTAASTTDAKTTTSTTEVTTTASTTDATTTASTTDATTTPSTTDAKTTATTTDATTAVSTSDVTTTASTTDATTTASTTDATTTASTTDVTTTASTTEATTTASTTDATTTASTTDATTTASTTDVTTTASTTDATTTASTTDPSTTASTTDATTTASTTEATTTASTTDVTTTASITDATTTASTTDATTTASTTDVTTTATTTDVTTTASTTDVTTTVATTDATTTVATTEATTTASTTDATTNASTTYTTTTASTTEATTTVSTTEATTTASTTDATTTASITDATTTASTTEAISTVSTTEATTTASTTDATTTASITDATTTASTTDATTTASTTDATTTATTTDATTTASTSDATTKASTTDVTTTASTNDATTTVSTTDATTTASTTDATTTVSTTDATTTASITDATTTVSTTDATTTASTTYVTTTASTTDLTTTASTTDVITTTSTTVVTTTTGSSVFDFIIFGEIYGDILIMGDDNSSIRLYVYTGLPARGLIFRYITISTNGILCLDNSFNAFEPVPLNALAHRDIIAAFWTDLVISGSSRLWYHVYSENDVNIYSLNIQSVLDEVTNRIEIFTGKKGFKATWVLVATWYRVRLFSGNEEVSFQIVLTTDGTCTYSFVNYKDFQMSTTFPNQNVAIGYKIGQQFSSSEFSFTTDVFKMPQNPGNTVNRDFGIYFMQLTPNSCSSNTNPAVWCTRWFNRRARQRNYIVGALNNNRHSCPCNLRQMQFSGGSFFRLSSVEFDYNMVCYSNYQYGISRVCCYHSFYGTIVNGYPYVSGLSSANPFLQWADYYSDTLEPLDYCCFRSGMCNLYRHLRPSGSCSRRRNSWRGFFYADPHITTLDGFQYTFNGLGEYIVARIHSQNVTFELQSRTGQVVLNDGPRNASVFTAFVARDHTNSSYQVELSESNDSMIITANGHDYTRQFYNDSEEFQVMLPALVLTRTTGLTLTVQFTESDVRLEISVGTRQLIFSITIPDDYNGLVSGLVGNFDGNPDNDLELPNGQILPSNSTEREIFGIFGTAWAVTQQTSLFTYKDGKSTNDYSNPDFVPVYLDELDTSALQAEIEACGGNSTLSKPCLYDYLATGDRNFALRTLETDQSNQQAIITLGYEAPNISGDLLVHAEVNKPTTLTFNATSQTTMFKYVLISQPTSGFSKSRDGNWLTMTWVPENMTPQRIIVTAMDDRNLTAEPIEVQVMMCSGCNGRGSCDYTVIRNQTLDYFKITSCNCSAGFFGDNCENENKACEDNPCGNQRPCIELQGQDYQCGDCNEGYVLSNKTCHVNSIVVISTTQRPKDSSTSDNFFLIIGLSIGIPVLVVMVIFIVCLLKRLPRKVTPANSDDNSSTGSLNDHFYAHDGIFLYNSFGRKTPAQHYYADSPWSMENHNRHERDISWS